MLGSGSRTDNLYALNAISLALAVFLGSLDQTIVATAIPRIASDFSALDQVAWIGIAYMLTSTASQPLYGRFSDIFGRKPVFLAATVIFLAGSLGCGAANSMVMLIIMRAIAGMGGGGFVPLVMIIIIDIAPLRQRGQYAGIVGAVFAFSSVIGPLLGGVFTDHATWRWAFYINLPIGFVTILVTVFLLKLKSPTGSVREKLGRVDYLGTLLVLGFCITLLLPVNWGGAMYAWNSPLVIALFCVAIALLGGFLFVEYRFAKEPIVPLRLFRTRSVCAICLGSLLFGWAFFSPIYYLPMFFQTVRGSSATASGLELLPFVLPISVMAVVSGTITSRVGGWTYRAFLSGGLALSTIALGLITLYGVETQRALEICAMIMLGAGFGSAVQTSALAGQASVASGDAAIITALNSFAQIIGGAIGLAVEGAVFNNKLSGALSEHAPASSPHGDTSQSVEAIRALPPGERDAYFNAFVNAFHMQYYVLIPVAGLAALVYILVKPLSRKQGGGEGREEMVMIALH
ncbi:major facilitator superfamily-domain-containing protein [Thamnocephalis sphaerospora]|uniref:Major facilitator superfamily-domain-containing protein n=1 Tax=Thamnocephalis sphaerospora TaxID=78915 RepID=A0A4P9XPA8_9FUNG|nr:major facilitator superfamily-domain-containing protein [Thamnocephalis sphaerospora]|eukprot:RKP07837.1 major facilitator superfamily-domain-containing protein [Thamnocephalis sphaerospora]